MRVLFHACCGPCFVEVGAKLREQGHEVVAFFYNPNIQPFTEFKARLTALKDVCRIKGIDVIVDESYEPERWLSGAMEVDPRCSYCYSDRLRRTANKAAAEGFDAFTTTLLASPYQEHELAIELGERIANETGVDFLYVDFRDHWKESRESTFDLGIYRQKYCGCLFSEHERYLEKHSDK